MSCRGQERPAHSPRAPRLGEERVVCHSGRPPRAGLDGGPAAHGHTPSPRQRGAPERSGAEVAPCFPELVTWFLPPQGTRDDHMMWATNARPPAWLPRSGQLVTSIGETGGRNGASLTLCGRTGVVHYLSVSGVWSVSPMSRGALLPLRATLRPAAGVETEPTARGGRWPRPSRGRSSGPPRRVSGLFLGTAADSQTATTLDWDRAAPGPSSTGLVPDGLTLLWLELPTCPARSRPWRCLGRRQWPPAGTVTSRASVTRKLLLRRHDTQKYPSILLARGPGDDGRISVSLGDQHVPRIQNRGWQALSPSTADTHPPTVRTRNETPGPSA